MTADLLELSAHGFDLSIAPLAGGGIARLDWHGKPILRPAVAGAVAARDPLGLSSFPMTPYASRIVGGTFNWGEVSTDIPPNMAGGAHPLHGIGWRTPWSVVAEDETSIEIALIHPGDANWPWAFESRQRFNLCEGHVELTLSVTSRDSRPFPSSLGPHPYFLSGGAEIQLCAAQLWEISGEALPSHLARPPVVDQLTEGVDATSLDLDHCFEGWNGRARIKWAEHGVEVGASILVDDTALPCTRLQLYTPPGTGFFCLEPVTARGVSFTAADPYELGVVELADQTLTIITTLSPCSVG
jgi:aldose 1-epimerase